MNVFLYNYVDYAICYEIEKLKKIQNSIFKLPKHDTLNLGAAFIFLGSHTVKH